MSESEMPKEPRPFRNFAIVVAAIVLGVVGTVFAIEVGKKRKSTREDAELYKAISNAVHKYSADVEQVAPFGQLQIRRTSSMHLAFRGWATVKGSETRKEFEAVLLDSYLTNGIANVVAVKIKEISE